jgi:hypothetical protein
MDSASPYLEGGGRIEVEGRDMIDQPRTWLRQRFKWGEGNGGERGMERGGGRVKE